MDLVVGIANLSVALSQERVQQDLGVTVLRKELDARATAAARMVQGLAAPVLPDHLGRNVNIRV